MSGPDVVDTETPSPPRRPRDERGRHFFQRISDRTPLRTKLITAVLALVIVALAVTTVASFIIVRRDLYTQRDTNLESHVRRDHALVRAGIWRRTPAAHFLQNVASPAGPALLKASSR